MKVKELKQFEVAKDGRSIILHFSMNDGSLQSLDFDATSLSTVIQDLIAASVKARQSSSLSKQGVVSASTPAKTMAGLAEGGDAVLISFQMENSMQHHFALLPIDAERLGQRILDAARKGKQTRRPSHS